MIEEIEQELNDKSLLHFREYKEGTFSYYQQFLAKFFTFNTRCHTYDVNGEITCSNGKLRSLQDIYLLTKNYFPDITLTQVMFELARNVKQYSMTVIFCPNIGKRVFFQRNSIHAGFAQNSFKTYGDYKGKFPGADEYGFTEKEYLNLIQ